MNDCGVDTFIETPKPSEMIPEPNWGTIGTAIAIVALAIAGIWDARTYLVNQFAAPLPLSRDDLRDSSRHDTWVGQKLHVDIGPLDHSGMVENLVGSWAGSTLERVDEKTADIMLLPTSQGRDLIVVRLPDANSATITGTLRPVPRSWRTPWPTTTA